MTEAEWLKCEEPDLMLEFLQGKTSHQKLVEFVRQCWARITTSLPQLPHQVTVVDQFAEIAEQQSDHDAATYAAEAAFKAAGWGTSIRDEQRVQAGLLRQVVGNPFRVESPA